MPPDKIIQRQTDARLQCMRNSNTPHSENIASSGIPKRYELIPKDITRPLRNITRFFP